MAGILPGNANCWKSRKKGKNGCARWATSMYRNRRSWQYLSWINSNASLSRELVARELGYSNTSRSHELAPFVARFEPRVLILQATIQYRKKPHESFLSCGF